MTQVPEIVFLPRSPTIIFMRNNQIQGCPFVAFSHFFANWIPKNANGVFANWMRFSRKIAKILPFSHLASDYFAPYWASFLFVWILDKLVLFIQRAHIFGWLWLGYQYIVLKSLNQSSPLHTCDVSRIVRESPGNEVHLPRSWKVFRISRMLNFPVIIFSDPSILR